MRVLMGCVLTAALLAGCSQAPVSTTARVVLDIKIEDGVVTPPPERVEVSRGQDVWLTVNSTQPVEVHVHGYDLLVNAGPGQPGALRFRADRSGRFDVEAHPDTLLVQLVVR